MVAMVARRRAVFLSKPFKASCLPEVFSLSHCVAQRVRRTRRPSCLQHAAQKSVRLGGEPTCAQPLGLLPIKVAACAAA